VLSAGALKWVAVTTVVGVGAVAATVAVRKAGDAESRPKAVVVATTASSTQPAVAGSPSKAITPAASATAPEVDLQRNPQRSTVGPPASAAATAATSSVSSDDSAFSEEVIALDRARAAIAGAGPAQALSILDDYGARFPRGVMRPEATVLRIEALVNAGDRAAAERAAEAFLRANPSSPYVPRIRTVLGSNP
jgi:hypothetical protein